MPALVVTEIQSEREIHATSWTSIHLKRGSLELILFTEVCLKPNQFWC